MSTYPLIRDAALADMAARAAYAPLHAAIDASFARRQAERDKLAKLRAALEDACDDYRHAKQEDAGERVCRAVREEWDEEIDALIRDAKALLIERGYLLNDQGAEGVVDDEARRLGLSEAAAGVLIAAAEYYEEKGL